MTAIVNNTIHIDVKVIELDSVWVRFGNIGRNVLPIDKGAHLFNTVRNGLGVLADKPFEKSRHTHGTWLSVLKENERATEIGRTLAMRKRVGNWALKTYPVRNRLHSCNE